MKISKTISFLMVNLILVAFSQTANAIGKQNFVFQLKGTSIGETREIDTTGDGINDTTANCFDVQLFNPNNGMQIGEATDCLSDVTSIIDDDPSNQPLGLNLALTATTFFKLPGGTLVVQGLTTVRPVLQSTFRDGFEFTHITGANSDSGVQYGTKGFHNASGKTRLSGQVDLFNLLTGNEIYFDCIFIVDLD